MQLYFHGTLLLSGLAAATTVVDNTTDPVNTMAQVEIDDNKDWVDVKDGDSNMLADTETDQLADSLASEVVQETKLG